MMSQLTTILTTLGALALGGAIGFTFGAVQHRAYLRHAARESRQGLRTGWSLIPGSFRRVALLLMALVMIQVVFPIFFEPGPWQWLVSAGVVVGYGWTLRGKLRERVAPNA